MIGRIYLSNPPTCLDAHNQRGARTTVPCHAIALTWDQIRDSTDFRRPTSVLLPPGDTLRCKRSLVVPEYQPDVHRLRRLVLGLGPTDPEWTSLPQETLGLRRVRFSLTLRYSCRHSHFRPLQPSSRSTFTADGTLPYHSSTGKPIDQSVASVPCLSPAEFSAQIHLTSELL